MHSARQFGLAFQKYGIWCMACWSSSLDMKFLFCRIYRLFVLVLSRGSSARVWYILS